MNYLFDLIIKASGMKAIKTDPNIQGADEVGAGTGHKITPTIIAAAKAGKGWKLEFVSDNEQDKETAKLGETPVFVFKKEDGGFAMTKDEDLATANGREAQSMTLADVWKGKYSEMNDEGDVVTESYHPHAVAHVEKNDAGLEEYQAEQLHHAYRAKMGGDAYAFARTVDLSLSQVAGTRGFNLKRSNEPTDMKAIGLIHLADITRNKELHDFVTGYLKKGNKSSDDFMGTGNMSILPAVDAQTQKKLDAYMTPDRKRDLLNKIMRVDSKTAVRRILLDTYMDFYKAQENPVGNTPAVPLPDSGKPAPPVITGAQAVQDAVENLSEGVRTDPMSELKETMKHNPNLGVKSSEVADHFASMASHTINTQHSSAVSAVEKLAPTLSKEEKESLVQGLIGGEISPSISQKFPQLEKEYKARSEALQKFKSNRITVSGTHRTKRSEDGVNKSVTVEGAPFSLAAAQSVRASAPANVHTSPEARAQVHNVAFVDSLIKKVNNDLLSGGCIYSPGAVDDTIDAASLIVGARHLPIASTKNPKDPTEFEITSGPLAGRVVGKDSSLGEVHEALQALDTWTRDSGASYAELLHNNTRAALDAQGKDSSKLSYNDTDSLYNTHAPLIESTRRAVEELGTSLVNHMLGGSDPKDVFTQGQFVDIGDALVDRLAGIQNRLEGYLNNKSGDTPTLDEDLDKLIQNSKGSNAILDPEFRSKITEPLVRSVVENLKRTIDNAVLATQGSGKDKAVKISQLGGFLEPLQMLPAAFAIAAEHGTKGLTLGTLQRGASGVGEALDALKGKAGKELKPSKGYVVGTPLALGVRGKDGNLSQIHILGKRDFGPDDNTTSGTLDITHEVVSLEDSPDGGKTSKYSLGGCEAKWHGKSGVEEAGFNYAHSAIKHLSTMCGLFDSVETTPVLKIACAYKRGVKTHPSKPLRGSLPRARGNSKTEGMQRILKGKYSSYSGCYGMWEE